MDKENIKEMIPAALLMRMRCLLANDMQQCITLLPCVVLYRLKSVYAVNAATHKATANMLLCCMFFQLGFIRLLVFGQRATTQRRICHPSLVNSFIYVSHILFRFAPLRILRRLSRFFPCMNIHVHWTNMKNMWTFRVNHCHCCAFRFICCGWWQKCSVSRYCVRCPNESASSLSSSLLQSIRIARVERYAKTAKYRFPSSGHKNAVYGDVLRNFWHFFKL